MFSGQDEFDLNKEVFSNFSSQKRLSLDHIYGRINSKLSRYNTEDILSGIIEYQLRDMLDPLRLNKAELIAGRLIKMNITDSKYEYLFRESDRLLDWAEQAIMEVSVGKLWDKIAELKEQEASPQEIKDTEKTLMMRINYIFNRGLGYTMQLIKFADKLYSMLDSEIQSTFGFTYSEAQKTFIYLWQKYYNVTQSTYEKLSKNIMNFHINFHIDFHINEYAIMPSVKENYIYRVYKDELYELFDQATMDNIISYFGVRLGESNTQFENVIDFNVLYAKPIIEFEEYVYLSLPINALQNLPKIFHYEFIAGNKFDKNIKEKYKKHRGELLENLTTKYLSRLLNKKYINQSLFYSENGHRYEADVTAQKNNSTILCECKSKLLVLDSLKGDLNYLEKDFNLAIGKAYEQAVRTNNWIKKGNMFELISETENKKVKLDNTEKQYILCIVVDDFGWIPTNISDYIKIEKTLEPPLVTNIFDLDIITKKVQNYKEFIDYLDFRRENLDKIKSVDELEIFYFFKNNKQGIKDKESYDIIFANGYTQEIDREFYKKSHEWIMNYPID